MKLTIDRNCNVLIDEIPIEFELVNECNGKCMECLRRFLCLDFITRKER